MVSTQLLTLFISYILISICIERALYQVFHTKLFKALEVKIDEILKTDIIDLKPIVCASVSCYICFSFGLDIFATIFSLKAQAFTIMLTGIFISGGSTALTQAFKQFKKLNKERE